MNQNTNPRIGVLLKLYGASDRLTAALWPFHKRGIKWLRKNWPETRLRRELRGCSREWNSILARRQNSNNRQA